MQEITTEIRNHEHCYSLYYDNNSCQSIRSGNVVGWSFQTPRHVEHCKAAELRQAAACKSNFYKSYYYPSHSSKLDNKVFRRLAYFDNFTDSG
jgi:hypothetical protein